MKYHQLHTLRIFLLGLLLVLGASACHRYRMPSPQGPPQPKVKKAKGPADGGDDGVASEAESSKLKPQKNSYDKNGLMKKPKYERRKRKKKVGQRTFLGRPLPWQQ